MPQIGQGPAACKSASVGLLACPVLPLLSFATVHPSSNSPVVDVPLMIGSLGNTPMINCLRRATLINGSKNNRNSDSSCQTSCRFMYSKLTSRDMFACLYTSLAPRMRSNRLLQQHDTGARRQRQLHTCEQVAQALYVVCIYQDLYMEVTNKEPCNKPAGATDKCAHKHTGQLALPYLYLPSYRNTHRFANTPTLYTDSNHLITRHAATPCMSSDLQNIINRRNIRISAFSQSTSHKYLM